MLLRHAAPHVFDGMIFYIQTEPVRAPKKSSVIVQLTHFIRLMASPLTGSEIELSGGAGNTEADWHLLAWKASQIAISKVLWIKVEHISEILNHANRSVFTKKQSTLQQP